MPELTLPALAGEPVALSALRGRPTLVEIWAPWCGVCQVQSQNLSLLQNLVGGHAQVVTVAASFRDIADVQRFVAEHEARYPVLLGDDEALRALRARGFPTLLFLDPQGKVKHATVGYTTVLGMLWRLFL
jgi:thiol-disulfide isomerase/thioredoxin